MKKAVLNYSEVRLPEILFWKKLTNSQNGFDYPA